MRICRAGAFLVVLCMLVPSVSRAQWSYRTPFSVRLEASAKNYLRKSDSPGVDRLRLMRFYYPDNHVEEAPGFWERLLGHKKIEEQQEEALAFFLFNMYVSTAAYQEDMPSQLTVDYLGVLDGFSKCRELFPLGQVDTFYTNHFSGIKARLANYFKRAGLAPYEPYSQADDRRERAFLRLLKHAPSHYKLPGYVWDGKTRLSASARPQDQAFLQQLIRSGLAEGQDKVVTFKVPRMQWENMDTPFASHGNNTARLYRCVNDECAYCSYLLGKQFCEGIAAGHTNWGISRLYKITAYPTDGQFLVPAQGERFGLASGEQASDWYYHTALLVVMNLNGRYTPFVADAFLAGEEPMLLDEWLSHFRPLKTYFQVDVFERSETVEKAIVTPSARRGDKVIVDGQVYTPYDVLP